ncbi:putative ATP-dependent helicase YprA [Prunus yedoensis var. nudiflora]|uniref:Putative ATP-dependent helicase YprA n=1 Tax=Prunus yedoensis var. nudiflora TaxID=2094558 RepID=A0A314ZL61_PRUYE|nr:putative ATP-dependent helicase YprA [Prunus yedoensis var. nudiflora]
MAENERQIQVRTLVGESSTVSVSVSDTIENFKRLLKRSFPPATRSPNFHLFFKGGKLGLQSKIGSLNIKPDEFLVLVPFSKKEPNNKQTQKSDQSKASLNGSDKSSTISNFADSAWSDMMQDLSSLQENSSNQTPMEPIVGSFNLGDRTEAMNETATCCSSGAKRKKGLDSDDIMLDILRCSRRSKNVLDEHNFTRFVEVLASVSCLSDPYNGDCMLWRRVHLRRHGFGTGLPKSSGSSCLCPPWLKIIMKAFAFLNTFSAFIQSRQERTTSILLEQALGHLPKFGVELGLKDIKNLSVISPKVVRFVNKNAEETSSGNAIVIINCSTEDNCKHGCKQMDVPMIVSVLKIRESSFRSNLWKAIEWLLFKTGNEISRDFSLEDLLISVKECDTAARGNEAKQSRITPASSNNFDRKHSAASRTRRCHGTDSLLPVEMVEHLRKGIGAKGQIVHVEDIGARRPVYVEVPHELSENMRSALHSIGITQLYSHQAESIQASLSGKNVVVATMTSSGKSLCYNLPVLEVLSQSSSSCALYLFPTKALAQDQLRALLAMTKGFDDSLNIGVYDGDTTQEERTWLRHNSRLLITNPDMLHVSILPHHRRFARILENLRFVVIDEAHIYKGAFGCHTAFILRRLRRLCSHVYGSDPSFVFSTATSANPHNHCMELASLTTLELIQNDGSPAARKLFILWNPFVDQETVVKNPNNIMENGKSSDESANFKSSSPILDVSCLFAEMVQHGLRCIAFCKTRKLCELVLCYTREILQQTAPRLVDSICAYRAGYIAQNRRRIECDFFDGKLCGIAATNALELGIDVGHVDVTLHLGFPGSISSLWQQAGRAGRRDRPSLAVYVAFEGPLDQYFMKYPKKLFGSPIECCHVDAKNQQVLEQQLVCAAHEHPLGLSYDEKFFGSGLDSAIVSLKNRGYLSCDSSCNSSAKFWNYIGHEKMPSHSVSIRSIETERYKVIDQQKKEILEEIEESRAFFQVYEGAVYMNQGKTYLVTSLDLSRKIALCYVADLKYYTKCRDSTDIHVIGSKFAYRPQLSNIQFSRTTAQADPCKVTTTWLGYYRVSRGSNEIMEKVDHVLPKYSYESQAVWVPVPQSVKEAVIMKGLDFRAGLHAASHVVLNVVPLRIICNLSDLAPECINLHTRYYPERILLYDQHPGGSGVSVQVQPIFMELLIAALELLTSCRCSEHGGCPNCLQSFACKEYNEGLHKEAAIMIVEGVLDAEKF